MINSSISISRTLQFTKKAFSGKFETFELKQAHPPKVRSDLSTRKFFHHDWYKKMWKFNGERAHITSKDTDAITTSKIEVVEEEEASEIRV